MTPEIEPEATVGGCRRIDIEIGFTVIEVKKDLWAGESAALERRNPPRGTGVSAS